jgi:microcystin-dependent protein
MEELMGTIKMFAGNFAPQGWMLCHGQELSIAQYSALFSLLGTIYGGDGKINFALPDLRGVVPIGAGKSKIVSIQEVVQGEIKGKAENILNISNMPKLKGKAEIENFKAVAKGVIEDTIKPMISIPCSDNSADSNNPKGKYFGLSDAADVNSAIANIYGNTTNTFMKPFENSTRISMKAELPVTLDAIPSASINIGSDTPVGIPTYQPSLGINFIICIEGVYPQRNY